MDALFLCILFEDRETIKGQTKPNLMEGCVDFLILLTIIYFKGPTKNEWIECVTFFNGTIPHKKMNVVS